MKKLFVLISLLISASLSQAGGGGVEVSGGGHGVLRNGQIELLDLVESGISNPEITETTEEPQAYIQADLFRGSLRNLFPSGIEQSQMASKLTELWKLDPFFSVAVYKTLALYDWAFVSEDLKPVEIDSPLADTEFYQIAIRKGRVLYVNQKAWSQMAPVQRVALVLHEGVSALAEDQCPSSRARQIVGTVFSKHLASLTRETFDNFLGDCLPSQTTVLKKLHQIYDPLPLPVSRLAVAASPVITGQLDVAFLPSYLITPSDDRGGNQNFDLTYWGLVTEKKDLNRIYQACTPTSDNLPAGAYRLVLQAHVVHVRFAKNEAENDLSPKVIWELEDETIYYQPRLQLHSLDRMGSCWSSEAQELMTGLSNFWDGL